MGIYEVLQITDDIREAIRHNKPNTEIIILTLQDGFLSISDDARAKILLGMMTQEECEKNGML